jgi:hypothetical protein
MYSIQREKTQRQLLSALKTLVFFSAVIGSKAYNYNCQSRAAMSDHEQIMSIEHLE